jgi:hypothetical protein
VLLDLDIGPNSDPGEVQRALLMVSAVMVNLINDIAGAETRAYHRVRQQDFDNLKALSMVLMSVSRTEREIAR